MNQKITQKKTDFPIGKSGFYLTSDRFDGMYIEDIRKFAKSLYVIRLRGIGNHRSDEIGTSSSTVWDMIIFDTDQKSFTSGYVKKVTNNLYAIFDIKSHEVGWPTDDLVVIKNIQTGRRSTIHYKAPANDGIVLKRKDLFLFTGEIPISKDEVVIPSDDSKIKRWAAFVNKEGKILHRGWCLLSEAEKYDRAILKQISVA